MLIFSVMVFSFFFLFFFKQLFNEHLLSSALLEFSSLARFNLPLKWGFYISRHIFNFFTKAWLFDIFVAKLARSLFFFSRVFFQRNIEGGLFEYVLVLYPVRKLATIGGLLERDGSMSGKLSVYLFNVLFGGFVLGSIFVFLIFLNF
jgi:hypothetical protein